MNKNFKDKLKAFSIGALTAIVVSGAVLGASGASLKKTVDIFYKDIKICVDGSVIEPKDANGNKVEPFIMDGTTYLPVRAVANAFSKDVDWDGATSTVYLGKKPSNQTTTQKTYSSILEEYTVKLQEATPVLIEEYKQEAAKNTNGLNGLAEILNKKLTKLAEIAQSGMTEMAELMYATGSGKYSEYQEWAGKLQDVYMEEGGKITDVYIDSAT